MLNIPIAISEVTEKSEGSTLTYGLDFESERISGKVDSNEAVKQAIKKALLTPRFKCLIYSNQYGSELRDVILGQSTTREFIAAMIPNLIEDALSVDTRILRVYDFIINFESDSVYVSFKVDTIYGTTNYEEVYQ